MYWWKVTLDKTGAILSVEQVAERSKDGKLFCFVEALDKAGACLSAKEWYRKFLDRKNLSAQRRIERLGASGLCRACRRPKHGAAQICDDCRRRYNDRRRERRRLVREGAYVKREAGPETAKERERRYNRNWSKNNVIRASLHALLRRFDELGPAKFREWLVSKIEAKRAAAEPPQAEAAE